MTDEQREYLRTLWFWLRTECHDEPECGIDTLGDIAELSRTDQDRLFAEWLADRRRESLEAAQRTAERFREDRRRVDAEYEARPDIVAMRAKLGEMTDQERLERNVGVLNQLREFVHGQRLRISGLDQVEGGAT